MIHRLTTTKQEIWQILAARPTEAFYINELIRLTGRYPNSVQKALNRLLEDNEVSVETRGNRRYYRIKDGYRTRSILSFDKPGLDWIKILNRKASYAFFTSLCQSNRDLLLERYGISLQNFWYNDITLGSYYLKKDMMGLSGQLELRIRDNPAFVNEDVVQCRETCSRLVETAQTIYRERHRLRTEPDLVLIKRLAGFERVYRSVFPFLTVPHAIERYFEAKIREAVVEPEALEVLLSPVTMTDPERDSALRLAAYYKANGENGGYKERLAQHQEAFCWLPLWSLEAKPLTLAYFNEEVKQLADKIDDPEAELKRFALEETERKLRFETVLAQAIEDREMRDVVRMLQEYIYLRTYRKNAICQAHYYHLPLLAEAGRRLGLNSGEVIYLDYNEINKGLEGEVDPETLKKKVQARRQGWAILMWGGKIRTITGVKQIVQTMEQFRIVAPRQDQTKVIKGRIASRGKALGKAKIVLTLDDLVKVRKGDILVAKMTTPDFVIAMRRCAGIVTDEGGATCHAAIVSRELGVPCVVATGRATQLLKDNDLVEVDASRGEVRIVEGRTKDWQGNLIKGKAVFAGKVMGKVRVVTDVTDLTRIKPGEILVTSQVTPDFLSALYRVEGLIIDEDSLTGHGVLYARALKIPCIMGTQFAREVLVDGQQIELNADKGEVRVVMTGTD